VIEESYVEAGPSVASGENNLRAQPSHLAANGRPYVATAVQTMLSVRASAFKDQQVRF
jgi:hypothetical protein